MKRRPDPLVVLAVVVVVGMMSSSFFSGSKKQVTVDNQTKVSAAHNKSR